MKNLRKAAGACALAWCVTATPLIAASQDDFASLKAVSDEELQSERGGFLAADGVMFDFSAQMRTAVNGTVALVTTLTWTKEGIVSQTMNAAEQAVSQALNAAESGVPASTTPAASPTSPGGSPTTPAASPTSPGGSPTVNDVVTQVINAALPNTQSAGGGPSTSTPAGVGQINNVQVAATQSNTPQTPGPSTVSNTVSNTVQAVVTAAQTAVQNGQSPALVGSVTVPGSNSATGSAGGTVIIQNPATLQNVVLNTASGQVITQDMTYNLTIGDAASFQASMAFQQLAASIARSGAIGAISALGH